MKETTKSTIAGCIQFTGVALAAPFLAVAALLVVPTIMFGEKIHSCTYGDSRYDAETHERYRLCKTCGGKAIEDDGY